MKASRSSSHDPARQAAYDALRRFYRSPQPLTDVLASATSGRALSQLDLSFASHLVYGVIRHQELLDFLIRRSTRKRELPRGNLLFILRLGAFQLLAQSRVPVRAAIHETVELARTAVGDGTTAFVNAVLRKVASEIGDMDNIVPGSDSAGDLSVRFSQPEWLISLLLHDYGPSRTRDILSAFAERLDLSVRRNSLRIEKEEFEKALADQSVRFERSRLVDDCYILADDVDARLFSPLLKGDCYAQNESSAIVVDLLSPATGLRILDLCAAPGGKTAAITMATGDARSITAVDLNPVRVSLLRENLDRLGLSSVQSEVSDGTAVRGAYDLVLVDAPCSGLGTLAKHPEIKYTQNPRNIEKLASLQRRLLNNAAELVRIQGAVVYSVCTLSSDETTRVAQSFFAAHDNFDVEVPERFRYHQFVEEDGMLHILPGQGNLEGMFAFKARRVS